MRDGTVCIREVQPQNGEVTFTFFGLPQYLGNYSSMLETSRKTGNPAFLYWSGNIIIIQQILAQTPR